MILEPSTCDSYTIDLMRLWRTTEHENEAAPEKHRAENK